MQIASNADTVWRQQWQYIYRCRLSSRSTHWVRKSVRQLYTQLFRLHISPANYIGLRRNSAQSMQRVIAKTQPIFSETCQKMQQLQRVQW